MTKPTANTVQLWAAGGTVVGAALVAIAWLFFINPKHGQTDDLNKEAAAVAHKVGVLQVRLTELRTQNEKLGEFQAQLASDRAALPATVDSAALLRQIQASGETVGVSISAITIGSQAHVPAGTTVYGLPVSVVAAGQADGLSRFIDQLQQVQPRAMLITGANLATAAGKVTLTVTFTVFVSPAVTPIQAPVR
jgi:Tfp pilus assembly protein PilO